MEEHLNQMTHQQTSPDKKESNGSIFLLFILLFFPAMLLGYIWNIIFFVKLRWKPYLTYMTMLLGIFLTSILLWIIKPSNLVVLYMMICTIISFLVTIILVFIKDKTMKRFPQIIQQDGWAKNFKYSPTIFEKKEKEKLREMLKDGACYQDDKSPIGILDARVPIGVDESGEVKYLSKNAVVYRYYKEANTHTLITGASGSGKSVNMYNMVKNDINSGKPIIVVDFKNSVEWVYFLSKWAKEHNRPFLHFISGRPGEYKNEFCEFPASYDPLGYGIATEKVDMVVNLREWDTASAVYKTRTQTLVSHIFKMLELFERTGNKDLVSHIVDWDSGGIKQFMSTLSVPKLKEMIEITSDMVKGWQDAGYKITKGDATTVGLLQQFYKDLNERDNLKAVSEQLQGLSNTMAILLNSSYGDWLEKSEQTHNHINIKNVVMSKNEYKNNPAVVLFSMDPSRDGDFAKMMGSIILSDLTRAASYKEKSANKEDLIGIYLDEFQTLNAKSLRNILEKSRSAGFCVTLSCQSIEQIVSGSGGTSSDLNALLDVINNFIVHAGSVESTALLLSNIVGNVSTRVWNTVQRRGGLLRTLLPSDIAMVFAPPVNETYTMKDRPLIPPSEFQSLSTAKNIQEDGSTKVTAYVLMKSCSDPMFARSQRTIARKTEVIIPDELISGVPHHFQSKYEEMFSANHLGHYFIPTQETPIQEDFTEYVEQYENPYEDPYIEEDSFIPIDDEEEVLPIENLNGYPSPRPRRERQQLRGSRATRKPLRQKNNDTDIQIVVEETEADNGFTFASQNFTTKKKKKNK